MLVDNEDNKGIDENHSYEVKYGHADHVKGYANHKQDNST